MPNWHLIGELKMARTKSFTFEIALTDQQILDAVMSNQELKSAVVAQFQKSLTPQNAVKTGKRRRRTSNSRVRRGLHLEMAVKSLAACGATNADNGTKSGAIKSKGSELGHNFGSTLNATLDALHSKGVVEYKDVSKRGAGKPRYVFWLKASEADSLAALNNSGDEDN